MVGIVDNKKIAELVIKQDDTNYEKINPETLATIVEDVTNSTGGVDSNVQQHIDNASIHLSADKVLELTSNNLKAENIKAGSNITIKQEEGTNNITISSGDVPTDLFLTGDDIVPEDATITITPIPDSNKINIRANIPDVSKFVEQKNIRAGNDFIKIVPDKNSNDITIFGTSSSYSSGKGIKITDDNVIINTMPDEIVTLNEGENIKIEGNYPNFTISSSTSAKIADWKPTTEYTEGTFVTFNNALFKCIENHTSESAFDSSKWNLIAGWSSVRQIFNVTEEDTTDIILEEEVPNKDVLIINMGGVLQQSSNYDLQPDNKTIRFINPIPKNSIIEVLIMSNVVLDTYDNQTNIREWAENTSYKEGNIAIFNGSLYQCVNRHISTDTFEKENWKLLSGYVKNSYFFTAEEPLSEITLPESVYKTSDVLVNVGNTLLQSNNYTLNDEGNVITFVEPIEEGAEIEVTVFGNAILQHPELPTPKLANQFVITNKNSYKLVGVKEANKTLGLGTLTTFTDNANKIVTINKDETDFSLKTPFELSGQVKVRDIVNGFYATIIKDEKEPEYIGIVNTSNDKISFEAGSVLSKDKSTMISTSSTFIKNPNESFKRGNNQGGMIGTGQEEWNQPIMTSNNSPLGRIITSEAQTDREGYRAMDGLKEIGNGWLANNTTATWEYSLPYEFTVESIDFYNQTSGRKNHSKDIDLWVNDSSNIIASFTALDEDYGHSHIEIENPVTGKTFGVTIKNSYGEAVGMKEIQINATYSSPIVKNEFYYIYAISNDNGTLNDIAISKYNENEIGNYLPNNFTKYSLIGNVKTDENWKLYDIYPNKNIKDALINGSLNGQFSENYIKQVLMNEADNKATQIIEQWGDDVPDDNGKITFPITYKKLMYVMANGVKIINKSNDGFVVDDSVAESVSWIAKGY